LKLAGLKNYCCGLQSWILLGRNIKNHAKFNRKNIRNFIINNKIEFKSTHNRLSLPIINRIYKKMVNGIKFDDIKICDNLIIDGHYRYISSIMAGIEIGKSNSHKTSATQEFDWNMVDFVDIEWDTDDKIQYLNELDAEFNNISIEKILEFTK
jgi:hypothetical protein